ncbi:TadG family pilus assembly protein [Litoreibacter janthinus]|uniref:Uncharacterized membrane protein n=1 Tax=Litoreibacter janthinus TaxID=670154 RepID=A0A1I6GCB7_9RHOB|nr:TadG family pilus assembly protein [Litoreibacter janthinus]SFR39798.1 Uncharacterized membrane protein [Litoreibacter janthinus]
MLTNRIKDFGSQENGTVAVTVSLMLTVIFGFVALGIDVAALYRERALLQSVSDVTALSAMAQPDDAAGRAHSVIARNSVPNSAVNALQTGRFLRNPAIAPEDRFTALPSGSPGINAVSVTLQNDAPLYFAKVFADHSHVSLARTALATRTGAASFELDSHIASLDTAGLNQALTTSYGASAELSAGDMQALADAKIDLGSLLEALDTQIGSDSRNPAVILNASTTAGEILAALQSVLPAGAANRLGALSGAAGSAPVAIADLIGGIDTDLGLTATEFLGEIEISALDVIRALVAVEVPGQALTLDTNVAVTGVIDLEASLTAGEPPAQSGWIALGEEGVQLHRAAVRLSTDLTLEPNLLSGLGATVKVAKLNLPIYTEMAGSSATLEELSCNIAMPNDIAASFSTAHSALNPANGTSVAALYLGTLPDGQVGAIDPQELEFADVLDVSVVIDLPLLPDITISGITIQARSHVAVGQSRTDVITFTQDEISRGATTKTFGSGNLLSSAVGDLLSPENTVFRVKPGQDDLIGDLAGPVVSSLLQTLPAQLLLAATTPVDGVLDAVLSDLGVSLGAGELSLTGHHCEPIRLAL